MVITAGFWLLSLYFQAHHGSLRTTGGSDWGLGLHHDSAQLWATQATAAVIVIDADEVVTFQVQRQ